MKNKEKWIATKFIKTEKGYQASHNTKFVSISSRLIASIQAEKYPPVLKEHAQGLLLDLGCGDVPLYEIYKGLISDNICIDWANTVHDNSYLDLVVDLNTKLPLEDARFDTVVMTDVLEHIANPNLLMSEIARLLKLNGKAIITVPFFYWLHEIPHDYFRYTEYALRMFCQNNDLKVISLQAYGGAPEVILDIISKNIAGLPTLGMMFYKLSRFFLNSQVGKNLSIKSSISFPLGYLLVAQKS